MRQMRWAAGGTIADQNKQPNIAKYQGVNRAFDSAPEFSGLWRN
jgi:hypothetical protein